MKTIKLGFVLTTVALFLFACSGASSTNTSGTNAAKTNSGTNSAPTNAQPTAPATDEFAAVKKIYSEKCVRCHKEDGTGGETEIDGTKIKAPNFTSDRMKKEPDSELIETIEKGATDDGMPAFKGKISDDEIKGLVKYIRKEFQKQ
jgi:mono/diheme cytochrome c family protein